MMFTEKDENTVGDSETNPLSGYGVSNEEFEFYKKLYEFEKKAFCKGIFVVLGIMTGICILIAIAV